MRILAGHKIMGKVVDKVDVAIFQGVLYHGGIKIGAWEYSCFTMGTVKIGLDRVFQISFICLDVDIAKGGFVGGW